MLGGGVGRIVCGAPLISTRTLSVTSDAPVVMPCTRDAAQHPNVTASALMWPTSAADDGDLGDSGGGVVISHALKTPPTAET
jgi:hypothetical protein